MKITEKPNTYRTTNKKLLDGRHDRLINVHCRDHVTRQKSKQRHRSLKLADFHNQSPLLTMICQRKLDFFGINTRPSAQKQPKFVESNNGMHKNFYFLLS